MMTSSCFRTGINPDLFWGGGLAELLESPSVLKILHAATVDAQSVYKDGVRMWNIFDTSGRSSAITTMFYLFMITVFSCLQGAELSEARPSHALQSADWLQQPLSGINCQLTHFICLSICAILSTMSCPKIL